MHRDRFVTLSFVAFGFVVASFVTLGISRLIVGYRTGLLLAAPFGLIGLGLVVVLFSVSVWTIFRRETTGGTADGD